MKKAFIISLALVALADANAQFLIPDGSLIPNGSFESGMAGWTTVSAVEALGPPRTSMPVGTDGMRAAAIGTFNYANASMSQVLHLTSNQSYRMTFDLLASGVEMAGLIGSVQVLATDGAGTIFSSDLFSTISGPTLHNGAEGFVSEQFSFSVPAGITDITLTFTDVSPNGGWHVDPVVDNIRLAVIPEPQAGLLALMGLSCSLAWRRRILARG